MIPPRLLIVGMTLILGISVFNAVFTVDLRNQLHRTEKSLRAKITTMQSPLVVPVLEGIEMHAVGKHWVKAIPYDIKFSREGDCIQNEYRDREACPGRICPKYEIPSLKREVPFHPLMWAYNALNASSYAQQTNRLQETTPLIDALVKEAMENAIESGPALYFGYPFRYRLADKSLEPPWFSGIAQAHVLAAWINLYRVTGEMKFRDLAEKTYRSFLQIRTKEDLKAPWVTFVDNAGYLWFEEYPCPTDPQPRVLNGHICAIMCLYSWYRLEPSPETLTLIRAGITTVSRYFNEFRRPGSVINYHLLGEHEDYDPRRAVRQQEWLYRITEDPYVKKTKSALKTDVRF